MLPIPAVKYQWFYLLWISSTKITTTLLESISLTLQETRIVYVTSLSLARHNLPIAVYKIYMVASDRLQIAHVGCTEMVSSHVHMPIVSVVDWVRHAKISSDLEICYTRMVIAPLCLLIGCIFWLVKQSCWCYYTGIYLTFISLPSSLVLLDISHSPPNGFNSWDCIWYCSDPPHF